MLSANSIRSPPCQALYILSSLPMISNGRESFTSHQWQVPSSPSWFGTKLFPKNKHERDRRTCNISHFSWSGSCAIATCTSWGFWLCRKYWGLPQGVFLFTSTLRTTSCKAANHVSITVSPKAMPWERFPFTDAKISVWWIMEREGRKLAFNWHNLQVPFSSYPVEVNNSYPNIEVWYI